MAIKSLLFGGLMAIAVMCASADATPNGNARTTMATLVTRAAPSPSPTTTKTTLAGLSLVASAAGCEGGCKNAKDEAPSSNQPERTCVREALVALANWRLHCDRAFPPLECWTRAPNVERCCGKWVDDDDAHYKDYPPVRVSHEYQLGETSWEWRWDAKVDEKRHRREVVLQTPEEFNARKTVCRRWRAENDVVFDAYMRRLNEYGISDADNTGMVIESKTPRYNPEGGGYGEDGKNKYPELDPLLGW
ncbi:hypothetical protein Z517_02058 [Fonsecaea pedrosoi CBS 271.37]|uniref:Unplaced genomic scaffold supercont1.2, whole genome shotgun sequence n=1 Tax=Fonsecaea pedrosoi CBS 271.37 TaxID=1442368 RepID=A0A0D2GW19_9EURO|nr:uncharacterized protein Z517_02058 [Fonsecaea pedrosoi CBS 271.37]KIW82815.1 hypothetical protein Z517_02058 [Fonsecaea pedrosoi CBS 271.37]